MPLKASDFRQHYIPAPLYISCSERHWLLDWMPSREVLKAVLRRREPQAGVPYFARGGEFDFELDLLIDALGLREIRDSGSFIQRFRLAFFFFRLLVYITFQRGISAARGQGA